MYLARHQTTLTSVQMPGPTLSVPECSGLGQGCQCWQYTSTALPEPQRANPGLCRTPSNCIDRVRLGNHYLIVYWPRRLCIGTRILNGSRHSFQPPPLGPVDEKKLVRQPEQVQGKSGNGRGGIILRTNSLKRLPPNTSLRNRMFLLGGQ
ncbi:hypothetical protein M404DRAFT_618997 [Pisolithus tinctorius Marx 270]|uniref:Uncharacterized protein n=1 Tax=Pisolithus tinctorius Marx 270 TaxID=870435 RepID=A0A0C3NRC8_PISTI|nr:hypothetical protein M404DRAFT_618997 [Pisolithus tinctorius Marx 270]